MACSRSLSFVQRTRLLSSICSLNYGRNYTTPSSSSDVTESKKETKIVQVAPQNEIFDIRRAPKVNLKKRQGVNIKHIQKENKYSQLLRHCLEESPDKHGFIRACNVFVEKDKHRRGHKDFIATALKFIDPYELGKESEIYEALMDIFPKDRFVNRSLFDAILPQLHPQMFLALDLLTKMEWHGIIPTKELHDTVYAIFGRASLPLQKLNRMSFWFEEMKDINPYRLDEKVYEDRLDIIRAAIDRILGNNDGTKILEISPSKKNDKENMIDYDHFIISSYTTLQKRYMNYCQPTTTIYIEGPTHIWINHKLEYYFIMKTGQGELLSSDDLKVDEEEEREGVVVGLCFATRPYNETLQRWLAFMQDQNPELKNVRVIFDVVDESSGEKIKVLPSF